MSFFLTVFLPGAFVAILTYHTQIIPIELLLSIIATREGVPFSTVVECALLILVFEIIREAGIRVPSSVSQPLSIVGAIVLGDAAVNARFVSSTMVIIVAMTALCGLMNTKLKSAVIVFRLAILIMGTLLGLYGVIISFLFMCIMILSMESFGVKYTDYSIFESRQAKKDMFVRALWSKMITRPSGLSTNKMRQKSRGAK
jgi:spore germination protein KA